METRGPSAPPDYGDYDAGDVAVINAIIDAHPELDWAKDKPASWPTRMRITWSATTPKRITDLHLNQLGLAGELDVSGLTALETIICIENNLTSPDVSGCTSLKELYCGMNSLISLKVFCTVKHKGHTNVASLKQELSAQLVCAGKYTNKDGDKHDRYPQGNNGLHF